MPGRVSEAKDDDECSEYSNDSDFDGENYDDEVFEGAGEEEEEKQDTKVDTKGDTKGGTMVARGGEEGKEEGGGLEGDGDGWTHIDFTKEIELLDQIGGGGVGLVYNGFYRDERVALKTLFDPKVDEELKKEFMDELQVMARCSHPNVVRFYGACMTPPNLCFVMELCRCSLFDLLHGNRSDFFTTYSRIAMCLSVCRGLLYLHSEIKLIHRDIKSHNILVTGDDHSPVLKLCDFGLVRTRNTTAGTPNYMAPELFGNEPFDKSVDVYAFALVMWEVFTQTLPFRGYDAEDISRVVREGERPEIPTIDVPVECRDIMKRGWSGERSERPSFEEIERTLSDVLERTPLRSAMSELDDDDLFNM